MSSSKKIFSSAGIVAFSTLLSRILGFIRDAVIAAYFGAGMSADAFVVAFRIPNLFRRLFAEGSLTTAYIPVFTNFLAKNGKKEAFLFAESSFRFFALFLMLLSLMGVAAAPYIIKIMAPGFYSIPEKGTLAVLLLRIMFPYLFFICLVALSMGILNSLEHFTAPALAPVFLNICMISSVLFLSSHFDRPVISLAWGVIAGGVVQLLFQFPFILKKGINPFKGIQIFHPEIKKILLLMGPGVFGTAVYQISILVNTILASLLPQGSISFLYYSDRLVQFPLALFGITAGIVVLPLMSKQVAEGKVAEIRDSLTNGLCFIFFITIPSTFGLIIIGKPIISLLFERGAFTGEITQGTYIGMVCYSVGLSAASATRILVAFFYSFKDAKTPVKAGIVSFSINIICALIFMYFYSYAGLALAVSAGIIVNFVYLAARVSSRVDSLPWKLIFIRIFYILIASFFMAACVMIIDTALKNFLNGGIFWLFLRIFCDILIGIIVFFVFSSIFKLPEIRTIKTLWKR